MTKAKALIAETRRWHDEADLLALCEAYLLALCDLAEKQAGVVEEARALVAMYQDRDWFPGLRATLAALDEGEQ